MLTRRTTTTTQALRIIATDVESEIMNADIVMAGPVAAAPGGMIRAALGGSYRDESVSFFSLGGTAPSMADRSVTAGFGELYFPVVGASNRRAGIQALEVSAAVRYDKYSDFGSTTNPRLGVLWSAVEGLDFRASYSESFRAPNASEQIRDESGETLQIRNLANPNGPGNARAFALFGGGEGLEPEQAETIAAGFDYSPVFLDGLRVSFNYYDIKYRNRIITPPFDAGALRNLETYGPLITLLSSDAEARAFLAGRVAQGATILDSLGSGAVGVRYIYDDRQQNVAAVRQSGFDIGVDYAKGYSRGEMTAKLNATVINRIDTSLGERSQSVDLVDSFANPVGLRLRADLGWGGHGWRVNAAVNYVDNYVNTALASDEPIGSWTTLDLTARVEATAIWNRSSLEGTSIALAVRNALDKQPPFVQPFTPTSPAYDTANAGPLGRFIGIELHQKWGRR